MATYTFTSSSVIASGAVAQSVIAAESLAAGDLIYLDATTSNQARKASNSSAAASKLAGICLNSAAAGQPVNYATGLEVTVQAGAFPGIGRVLVLAAAAGKCMDAADLTAGQFVTIVGWSSATNKLRVAPGISEKAYT